MKESRQVFVMEKWMQTCLLLCFYGLLKELRPSEPYLTKFLIGPHHNLTNEQVVEEVYPVWTYSYLGLLSIVFLITDFLRYKPVIVFEGFCYVTAWCLLIWANGVPAMQGVEVAYAAATATQVAYSTYIYAHVSQTHFQVVTAYTNAALLTGRFVAGVLAQILIATEICDYLDLNYISLGFVIAATTVAFFLPKVTRSIYFHHSLEKSEEDGDSSNSVQRDGGSDIPTQTRVSRAYHLLWEDFRLAYSNPYLLKWSIWWAFAMCGSFQVSNFVQSLWEVIDSTEAASSYNGAVEATHTLLSAAATLMIGYTPIDWSVYGEATLAIISLIEGVLLYISGNATQLWVAYVTYVVYCILYSLLITIASSEVAKGLKKESYGLVFGINTFMALLLQTILTLIVVDKVGFSLEPKAQFQVYGLYYIVLGAAFLVMTAFNAGRRNL